MGQCGLISQLACDRMRFYIATNAWVLFIVYLLCGNCFVALPFCGQIEDCFSFIAEIASLACSNKLACLKDVNLLTESDIDIAIN